MAWNFSIQLGKQYTREDSTLAHHFIIVYAEI